MPTPYLTPTKWQLHQDFFQTIFQNLGHPNIDLFATLYNHHLQTFVSPLLEAQAWDLEALAIDWKGLHAYVFPPLAHLPRVLQKLASTGNILILLVAPYWPSQMWFLHQL